MPAIFRPKHPAIYNLVHDWHTNDGAIHYVAHAITRRGDAILLKPPCEIGAGGGPHSHPDQVYWRTNPARISEAVAAAGGPRAIERIEIDCTLMPCDHPQSGCLYRVPYLIRQIQGLHDIPLRIFSHRDENLGAGTNPISSSKRYIECRSSAQGEGLSRAMNHNDGWGWVPMDNRYH